MDKLMHSTIILREQKTSCQFNDDYYIDKRKTIGLKTVDYLRSI